MLWADVGNLPQCTLDFVADQSAALIPHIFQEHFLFQLFPGKVFKLIISNQGGTIQNDEREKVHTILASSKNCHFLLVTKSLLSLSIFQMSNAETHLFWQQDSRKTWNYYFLWIRILLEKDCGGSFQGAKIIMIYVPRRSSNIQDHRWTPGRTSRQSRAAFQFWDRDKSFTSSQPLTTAFNSYKIPTVPTCRSWG